MARAKENAAVQNALDSKSVEESDKFYADAKKLKTSTAGAERMLSDFNRIQKPTICDQCPL